MLLLPNHVSELRQRPRSKRSIHGASPYSSRKRHSAKNVTRLRSLVKHHIPGNPASLAIYLPIGPQPISAGRGYTVCPTLTSLRRFEWCLELFQTSIGVSGRRANFAKERGTSNLKRTGQGCPLLRASNEHRSSTFPLEGGLGGLPLRVSNEGLPRPRVARAQETL